MKAYGQLASAVKKPSAKGILLSVAAGVLIAFFYSAHRQIHRSRVCRLAVRAS